MTPEAKATERIHYKLVAAGWVVQDLQQVNQPRQGKELS